MTHEELFRKYDVPVPRVFIRNICAAFDARLNKNQSHSRIFGKSI